MKVGRTVTVTSDIDLQPYTTLLASERGVLVGVKFDYAGACVVAYVSMSKYHKGLSQWDNVALLAGPELAQIDLLDVKFNAATEGTYANGGSYSGLCVSSGCSV